MCTLSDSVRQLCRPRHAVEVTSAPAPMPSEPAILVRRAAGRRKLWDLPTKLHCPVIGTCFEAAELRRLARRAMRDLDPRTSDYDLHVTCVSLARSRCGTAIALHKALEKKFAGEIRRFAAAGDRAALDRLWQAALERGAVPGALWAALTHPLCDDSLFASLYESIHMLSHQVGAGQRADLRRLSVLEQEFDGLQRDFDDQRRRHASQLDERDNRIRALERRLAAAEAERGRLDRLAARQSGELAALREIPARQQVERLQREFDRQARALEQARADADRAWAATQEAGRRTAAIEADYHRACETRDALEALLEQALGECANCEAAAEDRCPDLGGRRILCVGGRTQLVDQYRALVARCNGRFEHHDGGMEDNRQRLDALLHAADAVVCATDCVSHDAYYRLKRFCKRHEKRYVLVPSSGVSAFARAIETVAAPAG